MERTTENASDTVQLIYDGECILCRNTAQAIKIRKSVGSLELINARSVHPLVQEVRQKGYDLNEGILIKYQSQFYFAADALNFLALVGNQNDTFNKVNGYIFKYKWLAYSVYPIMKCFRNILLFIRKTPPI